MAIGEWLSQNWFDFLSTSGIIGSLWFGAVTLRSDTESRRVANLIAITANHREVWKEFFFAPQLARVVDPLADVNRRPVTPAEEYFVNMIVSHTSSVYEALKDELVVRQEGLRRDIKSFFSLPVPNAVWQRTKTLQNPDFAAFIDSSLGR